MQVAPRDVGRSVAGCDVAYEGEEAWAAWVVLDSHALGAERRVSLLCRVEAHVPAVVPYRPGFLAERELPVLARAFLRLRVKPDFVICDGAGIAHPRRFGLACALGAELGLPTIGCAKNRLFGECAEPELEKGSRSRIVDSSETLGWALRTKTGIKPVYISPGHLVPVEACWQPVLACCSRFRIPEPLREAHRASLIARSHAVQ